MKNNYKVVCIDDSPCKICGTSTGLIKNKVYVVLEISDDWSDGKLRYSILGFKSNCPHACLFSSWASAFRFRNLEELKKENKQKNYDLTTQNNPQTTSTEIRFGMFRFSQIPKHDFKI